MRTYMLRMRMLRICVELLHHAGQGGRSRFDILVDVSARVVAGFQR